MLLGCEMTMKGPKRQNRKFCKVSETKQLRKSILKSLSYSSKSALDLLDGKFVGSAKSGTSLESLDVTRASWLSYSDNISELFVRNSALHLVESNATHHHSLCAWLSLVLVGHDYEYNIRDIMMASRRVQSREVYEFYEAIVRNKRTKKLFSTMLSNAGTSARLTIQSTPSKKDEVVHKRNHRYPVGIPQEFLRAGKDKIEAYSCDVLAIDGMIMTVGEIHQFLYQYNETKENLVIFCRGLSVEVLSTLVKNYQEGRLNVYPVQIPSSEYANILHDISFLSGCETVSTLTGDVLASKDESCLGKVKNMKITGDCFEFVSEDPAKKSELVEKINDESNKVEDEFGSTGIGADVMNLRKACAASESSHVYVSKFGIGQEEIICDRLKTLTKIHGEFKERGCVDLESFGKLFAPLVERGIRILPTSSLIYALQTAHDTRGKLLNSGVVLLAD
ncbi:MAG: hypothetical protein CMA72_09655 [Euryarchaeota archaeon]|nr:hypothetical protein [Euryarchaeota archaeon]